VAPLVLCYHAVSPTWEHRLSIQPELLLRQVRTLLRFRRVRVTFDDAFRSASAVFPQLERLGIPIQIFVCSAFARTGATLAIPELEGDDAQELVTMTWDELRSHVEQGVDIGSHSFTHPHLMQLSDAELAHELTDSRAEIEDELGRPCPDLAYPYGEHDDRVRRAARAAGHDRAFALWGGPRNDPYALPRLDLYRRHTPARALLMATPLHRFAA
jgi:peptidoglycan/xylan/chitin deacetylase (PgdA/CDA1 family)